MFESLDRWIEEQNAEARREGFIGIAKCTFRIVGQAALFEANIDIEMATTIDVDAFHDAESLVVAQLSEILRQNGLEYDELSNEIWMPEETKYTDLYRGANVTVLVAMPEFVLLSKAKMALAKNKVLLREYIASGPPESFFSLCQTYSVNMLNILKD
jgi:hypothetical protein